jgi:hypothetical protein
MSLPESSLLSLEELANRLCPDSSRAEETVDMVEGWESWKPNVAVCCVVV